MSVEDLIVIAEIVKPWGTHGEVKALLHTDFPERFHWLSRVLVRKEGASEACSLTVRGIRSHGEAVLLSFAEVHTVEEAQRLCGQEILIPRNEVAPLSEGEYYIFDLMGLEVVDLKERRIGRVVDVLSLPAHDVYVVQDQGHEVLLPAVQGIILEINVEAGRMVVDPPEGLVEIYRETS